MKFGMQKYAKIVIKQQWKKFKPIFIQTKTRQKHRIKNRKKLIKEKKHKQGWKNRPWFISKSKTPKIITKIKQYKGCNAKICRTRNKNYSDKSPSWFKGKQETNRNT